MAVTKEHTNRLINEKSPYLLQHARNPVDWYPWSEEAFEKAEREDKPIFLSIGYSTCHWCHVMERESFEDEEVADILNRYYVSIKVDREERPDIDSIYMTVCQALTGHGGWPLTIIMTPDKRPFFAGTYFPKKSKYGYPGLVDILHRVKDLWENRREELLETSSDIIRSLQQEADAADRSGVGIEAAHRAYSGLERLFDPEYGGFGFAPKFPTPHNLTFLLRYWQAAGEDRALEMVEETLKGMYKGGIFDHIGFGFSRYSTDNRWLVPHFEKMLYDNALLAVAYTETYQATGKHFYRDVAEKILTYVLRDMTSPDGGFYSAEDADSEGEEGKFYVWTVEEVKSVVGEEDGELFCRYYGIKPEGNFEGKSIPNLIGTDIDEIEKSKDLKERLESIRRRLFRYRDKREHPYKDDKVLTSWNGLMIAAMAYAGRVLQREEYISAAERSVEFILSRLVREDGRLLARYRDGEGAFPAYLDDYAFLIWGLIELYQATFKYEYLERAVSLNGDMLNLFWDEKKGGMYLYGKDSEQLIARPREVYDGAIPSGNSVAALNMFRLARITGDQQLEERANMLLEAFGGRVKSTPYYHTYYLMALLFSRVPGREIVIAGKRDDRHIGEMLREINNRYLPHSVVVLNSGEQELYKLIPRIREQTPVEGKATAYICQNFTCSMPATDIDEVIALLERKQELQ